VSPAGPGERALSASTKLGLVLLALAALFGLLADWLLRATPFGLGATLWLLAGIGASAALAWKGGRLHGSLALGLALAPLFALFLSWRDSTVLGELDVLGLAVCLSLALLPGGTIRKADVEGLPHAFLLPSSRLAPSRSCVTTSAGGRSGAGSCSPCRSSRSPASFS
jgi:hypothetical protein